MTIINFIYFVGLLGVLLILKRIRRIYTRYSFKRYPGFFYKNPTFGDIGVPVFTYHSVGERTVPDSVTVAEFSAHMKYLAENGYTTLTADEFFGHIVEGRPVPRRSVLITFDDGRASLWTAAFPILKEYNLKAICFLVPSIMSEKGVRPSNVAHAENNLVLEDLSDTPAITWEEARIMQLTGLVDFQSHTFDHTLIHTSSEIVDFIHPGYRNGYSNFKVPLLRFEGIDIRHGKHPLGTPIYKFQPRMGASRRYFDDERVRNACIGWMEQRGGEDYFKLQDWKKESLAFAAQFMDDHKSMGSYETREEQISAIRSSLSESKNLIEAYLPGQVVRYLAYPWNHFSVLSSSISRELGYKGAFVDINPKKFSARHKDSYFIDREIPVNEPGDDPFMVSRIDARGDLVLSLPGKRRLTYARRILNDFFEAPVWLKVSR